MKIVTQALAKIVLITSFALAPLTTWANSHDDAAYALLDAMNINSLLSKTIDSALQMQLAANPALQPFEQTMQQFFATYMSGDSLRDEFAKLYVESYTEAELKEITAFYLTKTGQKSLAVTPDLMAKGSMIGQQRVQQNLPELRRMIEAEAARIKALQGN